MAQLSELPDFPVQEGALAITTPLLPADTSEISENPLEPSSRTVAESSNNEPRCQYQASIPLS